MGYRAPLNWAHDWPNGDSAGVYLVYSSSFELIYIGMSQCLGDRLDGYFGHAKKCVLKQHWGTPPRYVITIGFPAKTTFEVPALELFLIRKLRPKHNGSGMEQASES